MNILSNDIQRLHSVGKLRKVADGVLVDLMTMIPRRRADGAHEMSCSCFLTFLMQMAASLGEIRLACTIFFYCSKRILLVCIIRYLAAVVLDTISAFSLARRRML